MWSQPNCHSKSFPVLPSQWTSAGTVLSPFWGAEGTGCWGTQGQDFGVLEGRVLGLQNCGGFPLFAQGDPHSRWCSLSAQH